MAATDQNLWWLVLGLALALFMVHAMMEFTVSLLVRRPKPGRRPIPAAALREHLVRLNEEGYPFRLAPGKDCDYELQWDLVDATWRRRFATAKLTQVYRARLLIDEAEGSVRMNEYLRSANLFIGFDGWIPRINGSIYLFSGFVSGVISGAAYGILPGFPPRIGDARRYSFSTDEARNAVAGVVLESGWTLRPVIWWFQATRNGVRRLAAITPARVRQLPATRFWALVYLLSYALAIAALLRLAGSDHRPTPRDWLIVLFISAVWWSVWALLAWLVCGAPKFLRNDRR